MGLFARASSLAIPGKTAGGLLQRSLAILQDLVGAIPEQNEQLPSRQPSSRPEAPLGAEELTYRVAAIPAGFTAPLVLFALLRQALGLRQAALLSYDHRRHCYSPLATVGLDTTSRHRLRLVPGANPDFNSAASGNIVEVRGEGLTAFREYFSSREFSTIRELVLVPYQHNQRLIGLLLATRLEQPLSAGALALLEASMAPAGQLFQQEEEPPNEGEAPRPPAERLQALLAGCRSRGNPLMLIRLRLENLIRLAQEKFPELESFRLQEFLIGSYRRLLRGIGEVENPKPPVLVLLVHGMKEADPPLLLRQLEIALLRGLVDVDTVDLQPEVLTVTDDVPAALEFLGS